MGCGFKSDASIPVCGNDTSLGAALDQIRRLFRHHQYAGVDVGRDKRSGMAEASTTRSPSTPYARNLGSSTASSDPIRLVPAG
jgi:hypothetical protein